MQCEVYRCNKKIDTYLFVKAPLDMDSLPDGLTGVLGKLELAMSLEITKDKKLARDNAKEVIENIESQGFYLQLPPEI